MLKGIPEILSPELLKVLCEMGHSDRLVIADGNFPVESMGKNAITIRCDGHGVPEILDAILKLFPLDTYVEHPVNLMEVMPGDNVETPIWDTYKEIVAKYNECSKEGEYFQCHTDITIPYEELDSICAITLGGDEILLIKDGKFVLFGTETLNEPLTEID